MRFQASDFSEALAGDTNVQSRELDHATRLDIAWEGGGVARLDVYDDRVYWQTLNARGLGVYEGLVETAPPFLKQHGIRKMEMALGINDGEQAALEARGGWYRVEDVEYAPGQFGPGMRWDL